MDLPTLVSHTLARTPGQPRSVINKRSNDNRIYIIDCSTLLQEHELALSVENDTEDSPLVISNLRTRYGKYVEIRVSGGTAEAGKPKDYTVDLLVTTTQGQVCVQVDFRVFP